MAGNLKKMYRFPNAQHWMNSSKTATARTLHLPLKREYFEAIRDGSKPEEFRLCTEHWRKRL